MDVRTNHNHRIAVVLKNLNIKFKKERNKDKID